MTADGVPVVAEKGNTFLFTSEALNEGHPDKIADQVADAVLDECLKQDLDSKVACEVCVQRGMVMLFGELTTKARVDYDALVRATLRRIGFDGPEKGMDFKSVEVLNRMEAQSPDIAEAVHGHFTKADMDIGAGDQGCVAGYATAETPELVPLSHLLALRLSRKLSELRCAGGAEGAPPQCPCPWLWPDGTTQVTLEYRRDADGALVPVRLHTVVIAAQHAPDVSVEHVRSELLRRVVQAVCPPELLDDATMLHINSAGAFNLGGPDRCSGLSGRSVVADTYGGWGSPHLGALSGKDCSKVDRFAAYGARRAAASLVGAGLCARCLVQVTYAISLTQPLAIAVDSYGSATGGRSDADLCAVVQRHFDLRPGVLARNLNLKAPRFGLYAAHGPFGRAQGVPFDELPEWERVKDLSCEFVQPLQ